MQEIWKTIDGFSSYQVSNYGRIKSVSRIVKNKYSTRKIEEKILTPKIGTNGYYSYPLGNDDGVRKSVSIHRLVAKAFIPNPNNLPCVNHKDENKLNNEVANLEWCTYSYNNNYNNRKEREIKTQQETSPKNKAINQLSKNGKIIATFISLREAQRETNIPHNNISEVINGKRKTAGGFYWGLTS